MTMWGGGKQTNSLGGLLVKPGSLHANGVEYEGLIVIMQG